MKSIDIIDPQDDSSNPDTCHFCDKTTLPMIQLSIPNYKMLLRLSNSCFKNINEILSDRKKKMDTFERLVDALEEKDFMESKEDWNSMTNEERAATGCYGPAEKLTGNVYGLPGAQNSEFRNGLRRSMNAEYKKEDTRVEAVCPNVNIPGNVDRS